MCKLCHYVNEATVKSNYYPIFHSHLSYVYTTRGQNLHSKHHINLLEKKAVLTISFGSFHVKLSKDSGLTPPELGNFWIFGFWIFLVRKMKLYGFLRCCNFFSIKLTYLNIRDIRDTLGKNNFENFENFCKSIMAA